jgi:hypothetical protein
MTALQRARITVACVDQISSMLRQIKETHCMGPDIGGDS